MNHWAWECTGISLKLPPAYAHMHSCFDHRLRQTVH